MDSTALPFCDILFKEYLLFRGFTDTLQAFGAELRADKIQGFQVDRICGLLFRRVLPSLQCTQLMELLQELDQHVYCRLDRQFEEAVGRMEVALVRYFIVTAVKARRPEKVKELFELYGEALLSARDGAAAWQPWFTLPYVTKPEGDPRFQVYFTPQWAALVESSFRNLLAQAFQQLPLPAVLRYDADRAKRAELQRFVEALKKENAELRSRLGLPPTAAAAGGAGESGARAGAGATATSGLAGSGGSGAAAAALAAAMATDLFGGRPGTPVGGGPTLHPPSHLQQQQQQQQPMQLPASPYQSQVGGPAAAQLGAAAVLRQPLALQHPPPQPRSAPQLQLQGRPSSDGDELLSLSSNATLASQEPWGSVEGSGLGAVPSSSQRLGRPGSEAGGGPAEEVNGLGHARTASLAEWYSQAVEAVPVSEQQGGGAAAGWGPDDGGREAPGAALAPAPASPRGVLRQREALFGGHEAPITCCVFGPQGTNVASASADGVVRIWAPGSLAAAGGAAGGGKGPAGRCGSFSCGSAVTRLAWDRRGDKLMLVGTRGRGLKAWHLDTQRLVFQVDPEGDAPVITDLACSPTDPTFACATSDPGLAVGRLGLWNMRAFKKAHTFAIPAACALTSTCFSHDGHQLVAAGIDGKVRLFDPSSRTQVMAWPVAEPGVPFAACFLGSSRLLATLSADGYIKLWSTTLVRGPLAGLHVPHCSVQFGDGARRGGGGGGRAGLGPTAAGAVAVQSWRASVASNQAGTAFAATSLTAEVPVVCVYGGGEELRLEAGQPGHSAAVTALDWHPDGRMLLTGSVDCSLVLSDVRRRDAMAVA